MEILIPYRDRQSDDAFFKNTNGKSEKFHYVTATEFVLLLEAELRIYPHGGRNHMSESNFDRRNARVIA